MCTLTSHPLYLPVILIPLFATIVRWVVLSAVVRSYITLWKHILYIMRLSTIALFALLSSASAFAPAKIATPHRSQSSLQAAKNDNNNQFGIQIEEAKNAFLGTVTAATLLMGTLAPLPDDVANAAASAPAAPATTTATKKAKEPVAAPAPLAAEKAAVASAKAAFTATQKVST